MSRKRDGREIIKRIIIRGVLILDTPTCLSNGDVEGLIDMMLLRDSISPKALLTGSSIAGALRNYLHEYEKDYGKSATRQDRAVKLFGDLFAYQNEKHLPEKQKLGKKQQDTQSPLIIDDAISTQPIKVELRDGVKINSLTRTADDGAKYDLELLQAGTKFPLSFELLIERDNDEASLVKALAIALSGLEKGEVSLGMKKQRGFGRCHVDEWQVWQFDLTKDAQRLKWLNFEHWHTGLFPNYPTYPSIKAAFEQVGIPLDINGEDKRDRFTIHATFQLVGSLIIRSGQDSTGRAPDVVHLKSHRNNELKPILSGTSLAGVLRHRAERIVKTLGSCSPIVEQIFGYVNGKQAKSSRLVVHEKVIEVKKDAELVQTRIAIDRFTGGAYHGALFEEQPIFGGDVTIELELRNPEDYEIGLLLLLLKDLWTQDLPVGGESSIGRGRLKGQTASMTWFRWDETSQKTQAETWIISQSNEKEKKLNLTGSQKRLENFVQKFVKHPNPIEDVKKDE